MRAPETKRCRPDRDEVRLRIELAEFFFGNDFNALP
jgi:hypothetical protein